MTTDVFLSYAHEDIVSACQLAVALQSCGVSVWWDRRIPVGEQYDRVIEQKLAEASFVVVLWSSNSVQKEWVLNEAAAGVQQKKLLPVLIEDVGLPLEFRRRQCANLIGWSGAVNHDGYKELLARLSPASPLVPLASNPFQSSNVVDSVAEELAALGPAPEFARLKEEFIRRGISADDAGMLAAQQVQSHYNEMLNFFSKRLQLMHEGRRSILQNLKP